MSNAESSEDDEKWYETILKDLDEVEGQGGVPGTIVVFDHLGSQPILTRTAHQTDVIVAGGALGKGKLIAFAHTAFAYSFKSSKSPFYQNIQKWLVGELVSPNEIHDVSDEDPPNSKELASAKVLVWIEDSQAYKSEKFMDEIRTFLVNGGGLVIGATMWGHLQRTSRGVADMSTNKFLIRFGLFFTDLYARGSNTLKVSENLSGRGGADKLVERAISQIANGTEENSEVWDDLFQRCFPWFSKERKFEIWNKIEDLLKDKPLTKKTSWPVSSPANRVLIYVLDDIVSKEKLPGIQFFPGDFKGEPKVCSISISTSSTPTQKYYPTGYYAPAGKKITISDVVTSTDTSTWTIMIGSHNDVLYKNKTLHRWPVIHSQHKIPESEAIVEITSRHGGLIYLVSPMDSSQIKLRFHDVVKAPYFDLNEPKNVKNWRKRRMSPGLWADLCGEFVMFTVPSNSIRDLKEPTRIIQFWDSVLREYYDLKGRDIEHARKEWIVFDIQPSAGFMHAGYPIVAEIEHGLEDKYKDISRFALNYDVMIKRGSWGLFHELGHNVQEKPWGFEGTGEVTCNIFTLYAMETICKIPCFSHYWLGDMAGAKDYLNREPVPDFDGVWKERAGLALIVYAQLAHHFGWEAYKKVFRFYVEKYEATTIQKNQEKIDKWVIHFSDIVGMNLVPLFEFWAIPFSDDVPDELKALPPFLPDDKVVRMAEARAAKIRKKYFGATGP